MAYGMSWIPGRNAPALRTRELDVATCQIMGNLFTNLSKLAAHNLLQVHHDVCGRKKTHGGVRRCTVISAVAILTGVSKFKIAHYKESFDDDPAAFGAGFEKSTVKHDEKCNSDLEENVHSLPEVELCSTVNAHESSDDELDLEQPLAREGLLGKWKTHEQYAVGMRLAELSTMWHVNGWSVEEFAPFVSWASKHFPAAFGNINHSKFFLNNFLPSLVMTAHTGIASQLHAIVPATGLPSFLSRVLDIVSIKGRSLLPLIHVFTGPDGHLSWALLGCPCLEYREQKQCQSGQPLAPSEQLSGPAAATTATDCHAGHEELFGFHKAKQIVQTVHSQESKFHIHRDDRAMRLITSIADNAIQGPNSVHFSREERRVDNIEADVLAEAICKFHLADSGGSSADKLFFETLLYDRLVRLVRRHFAWGTGDLILRSVAEKFSTLAKYFQQQQDDRLLQAAEAETQGQPLAAQRLRFSANKCGQEAQALHRAGWTQWFRPRAPKADGTRKVVWQTKSRESFFQIYGLVYWGILARMQQTLERARITAREQGSTVTKNTGMRTREMCAWRSLGKAMTDQRVLMFNLGRADFRKGNLAVFAMEVQSSLCTASTRRASAFGEKMLKDIGTLVEMRGIVNMMRAMCSGLILVDADPASGGGKLLTNKFRFDAPRKCMPTKTTLWTMFRTFLAHRCWRAFPNLAAKLPEIIFGGSYRGISLHARIFDDPNLPLEDTGHSIAEKRAKVAAARDVRFDIAVKTIDRIISWAKTERRELLNRILQLKTIPARAPVAQGDGLPYVGELEFLENLPSTPSQPLAGGSGPQPNNIDNHEVDENDESVLDRHSFAPKRRQRDVTQNVSQSDAPKDAFLDVFVGDFIADEKLVQTAAMDLADACARMSDIASIPQVVTPTELHALGSISEQVQSSSSSEEEESNSAFGEQPPVVPIETHRLPCTEKSEDWIIHRNTPDKSFRIERHCLFLKRQQAQQQEISDDRTKFLSEIEILFGPELITHSYSLASLHQPLAALWEYCSGRFWNVPPTADSIFQKVMKCAPPPEVHKPFTFEEFGAEYNRFRAWLQSVEQHPAGHEFFKVSLLRVRHLTTNNMFDVHLSEVNGASLWQPRWVPKLGSHLSTKRHGTCELIGIVKTPDMNRFYSYCQSTSLQEVRARRVWHFAVAYQLFTHASVTSQSLAECVGSFLQILKRRDVNDRRAIKTLVWATQLKSIGLKGMGNEEGILSMALNLYFDAKGPEGWHFQAKRSVRSVFDDRCVQRSVAVRLQRQPQWISTPLLDLIKSGQVKLAKSLPRPELAIIPQEEMVEYKKMSMHYKRQRVAQVAERQLDPKTMSDTLWNRLGICTTSLPTYLRPGHGRR